MQTANVQLHNPLKAFLAGGLLAFVCSVWPQTAQADTKVGLYPTYLDWAIANEWVVREIDSVTGKTNLTWQSGFEPTDDKDSDGLQNVEEFNGWQATINGHTGWFTYDSDNVPGGLADPAFFGYGPDPVAFDTDCDGISDLYESGGAKYSHTNPRAEDTDGDKEKDPVEIYAGLDPKDDGYVYTTFKYETGFNSKGLSSGIITGDQMPDPDWLLLGVTNPITTLQHPQQDIDGDGFTTVQELKKANKIIFSDGCPDPGETRDPFPNVLLDEAKWTNPFDCDTDDDWLLDSFEKSWKGGFDATIAEPNGDTFHYNTDPDKDGLTNFREQAQHPLLAYSWAYPLAVWPFYKGDTPVGIQKVSAAGLRYSSRFPKGRILHGTVGYLTQAQYNKFGDQASYFTATYKADGTPDKVVRKGVPGTVRWPSPKTYWTQPRPEIIYHGWDTDGDLLPDGWEVEHGLNPLSGMAIVQATSDEDDEEDAVTVSLVFTTVGVDPGSTFGDPDKDNLLNLEEYFGADGYRVDYITGTGDETIPWTTRSMNYQSQSTFETHLNENWILLRHPWQPPVGYAEVEPLTSLLGLDLVYSMSNYPGFFNPVAYSSTVTNMINVVSMGPPPTTTLVARVGPYLLPAAGVASFPLFANDMAKLYDNYGQGLGGFDTNSNPALLAQGMGGFQPFSTAYGALYYIEPVGKEDGRYTPGVDMLWYALSAPDVFTPGDLILSDNFVLRDGVPSGGTLAPTGPLANLCWYDDNGDTFYTPGVDSVWLAVATPGVYTPDDPLTMLVDEGDPIIHDGGALAAVVSPATLAGTAFANAYYFDNDGDAAFTPLLDPVWLDDVNPDAGNFTQADPGAFPFPVLADTIIYDVGTLATATGPLDGHSVTDNAPLMVPNPGKDTDSDGLPDSMEILMDVARGKQPTSPVQALNPLVARSAKIVTDTGSQTEFVDYQFCFARDFTVEAWVYLEGDAPAGGSFVKGFVVPTWLSKPELKAYDLGVTNVPINGQMVSTVPYVGFHTVGGAWTQVSATRPLPRNRWVHLAGTFDHVKQALSLYVDGTLVQSREVGVETVGNYLLLNWGAGGAVGFATGTGFADRLWIDELRIWGVERSSKEVADNRGVLQAGRQAVWMDSLSLNSPLMAYYNFDDGGDVAVDGRHRAFSSLLNYSYPGVPTVENRLFHEYFYSDRAYALPSAEFGGGFVFDAGRTAPVYGALDTQRGELDSDGDKLPDSWEIVQEMNPFSWLTKDHLQATRYDTEWALVGAAEVLISRSGNTFQSSLDGGANWVSATCTSTVTIVNGQLTTVLSADTVLIGSYTTTTNTTTEGSNTTTSVNTVTNWQIVSGQVSGFIEDGQTWWVSKGGVAVVQVGVTGSMMSDADGDSDDDGLTNLQEYWSRSNPRKFDTDENGIPDGEEDFDGDGLSNRQEVRNTARPDLVDTDDDGMTDSGEVSNSSTPSDSTSPKQGLAAYFNGKPGSWLEILDRSGFVQNSWTLEAKILPANRTFLADGQGAPIFRRGVEVVTNGMFIANYELRVVRSGTNLYPEARFVYRTTKGTGVPVAIRGTNPLPVSATYSSASVTHLAATYDGSGKRLTLYVNGEPVGYVQDINHSAPATGEGPISVIRIGERFNGFVDELRLWSTVRDRSSINETMSQVLEGQEENLASYFNFDDGGWPTLASNTWNTARMTNLLYSVKYTAAPAIKDMIDGDTWVVGTNVFVNDSGVVTNLGVSGAIFDGTDVVPGTGIKKKGDFGWNHAEGMLYHCYDGTNWLRWGKGRYWLSDARATIVAQIGTIDGMLLWDPTPGDMFVCPADQVVYIYNGVSEDGSTVDLKADPLLPGHRFYVRSQEAIMEWDGTALVTVAKAADEDGLYIVIQSEGMAYKSEDKIWRRWGFVPSTEDYTVPRDWETQWAAAAKMSGVVEFYVASAASSGYVPSGGKDTDGDGLPDSWEIRYGLNYLDGGFGGTTAGGGVDLDGDNRVDYVYNANDFINGAWGDPDNDGLNNRAEWLAGTNPFEFDTDGDGVGDYDSPATGASYGSLYMDGDNIPDGWESLFPSACSPLKFDANLDPDGDGWDNYSEYMAYYLTHSANVYTIITNNDGTVSSNWTSGSGYSIPYCNPASAVSYPKPDITFRFKTDCPETLGTLRIWAYMDPEMNCPDAMTSIALEAPLRDGNSLSITDWMDGGHLRQGKTYFMAFVDANNDGQWNEGELMGFSEYMPENISWGEATIEIALREQANGFARIAWTPGSSDTNVSATSTYTIRLIRNNVVVGEFERGGCSANRHYLHEFDFRNATGANAAMSTGAMYGVYTWQVRNANNALMATGTNTVDYPATLATPTIQSPVGTVLYAKEKLRMVLDPATTQIQIQIQNVSNSVTVLNTTQFAPYINRQGVAEVDLPVLAGWGSFTNGSYRIQVRAFNPRAAASSSWMNFTVSLTAPAKGGPGMITGRAYYYGWAPSASIVAEAFGTSGFDQRPVARVKADVNFNFKLMGLPIGNYYVRAFHDQNSNGTLDAGEAWSLVKGAPATVSSINWVAATISKRGGVSTDSATSIYASDYSAKMIEMKSAAELSGNDLIIHDADSDNDGLPDVWEKTFAGNLATMNEYTDSDNDGLSDFREYQAGTNPTVADTDGDGLTDGQEVNTSGTDPLNRDTDGDGLSDNVELAVYGTNPLLADTDGDGLTDGQEVTLLPTPTNPLSKDSDGDGLPDKWEVDNGLLPMSAAGVNGAAGDPDGDGRTNAQELADGTNPQVADTDGDGLTDGQEAELGTNPLNPDSDDDGYADSVDPAPLDPSVPTTVKNVSFRAVSSDGQVALVYEMANGASTNVVIESSTNLASGSWSNELQTNISQMGSYTNLVPAAPGSPVKFFRIRFNP